MYIIINTLTDLTAIFSANSFILQPVSQKDLYRFKKKLNYFKVDYKLWGENKYRFTIRNIHFYYPLNMQCMKDIKNVKIRYKPF